MDDRLAPLLVAGFRCRERRARIAPVAPLSFLALAIAGSVLLGSAGCATPSGAADLAVRRYEPGNVFRFSGQLPKNVKRLGVLPVVFDRPSFREQAADLVPEVVMTELGKTGAFELTAISGEQLEILTGSREWSAEEPLPAGFFELLREKTGLDAVLFTRITRYRPFPPMMMGWHMKVVLTGEKPLVLWSADEVFDSTDPGVAKAARYYQSGPIPWMPAGDGDLSLLSPRRFGQYTAGALFATLPVRGEAP